MDDSGHLILLHRLDDTRVAGVNVGIGKARTAATYRRPSRDTAPCSQGGLPLKLDGKVITGRPFSSRPD